MEVSQVKISELSRLSNINKTVISRYFKEASSEKVMRCNNRIVGLYPEAVAEFLKYYGKDYFNRGAIILSANLCGGVGKTTGTHSLSAAARRLIHRDDPIVMVDTDSQGSFTASMFGSPADDDEPILIDFLEGKANIRDILNQAGDNVWFIKSNLNQVYIDRILSKPIDIKRGMLQFYQEIFNYLGEKTKILQDHTPQLSSIFASSVCALSQLSKKYLRTVIIPMRSDNYAIDGAEKILNEITELHETFNLESDIDIHCYFSSIDRRISTTSEAIKWANKKESIIEHLCPVVIRYCSEIPKSIQKSNNIYTHGKSNNAAEDYQDLLQYIFSYPNLF
ncbi:ParA family protein [Fluoribacter gormanii]|uniref:ParA family protein n=1 Tax=Fluoribacter gormanii TaxID=464 RepID=UPI00104135AB|nr:ParA family protein [Fluoribacter gormanii]